MILLQVRYSAGKTIFSCGSSLKEQTWLAIYAVRCPHSEEVQPAAFIPTCNAISKRQALPCLFFYTSHNLSPCNDGKNESRQANRLPWVDRDGTDLKFKGNSIIFTRM